MKKLNRKGFTLVELLAVIIILAIVVGITIPAVLGTINNSKNSAMDVAVEAAQTWLEEQAMIYNTDTNSVDGNFSEDFIFIAENNADGNLAGQNALTTVGDDNDSAEIEALGLKASDINTLEITSVGDGRACVRVTKIPTSSQYYNTKYWTAGTDGTATPKVDNAGNSIAKNASSHC